MKYLPSVGELRSNDGEGDAVDGADGGGAAVLGRQAPQTHPKVGIQSCWTGND